MAERFGVTPRTILYYEEEGIISPIKTEGGTRLYSEADIRRFGVAYRMAALGIPLKVVAELANIRPSAATGDESGRALCRTLDAVDQSVRQRVDQLDKLSRDIERARTLLKQCWRCPNKPDRVHCPNCPCETGKEDAEILWLTWDVETPPRIDSEVSTESETRADSPQGRSYVTQADPIASTQLRRDRIRVQK
ncbi:MerR family transcriptional regulator [Ancylobacter dichloromethanicus]|uniref:MerR family transcriptional regulator n=1 Tax=Ancylobacter dichloromethanicus TaxID=518825 RepID=UPI001BCC2587|nr:MerR family transcriptional regulator [Ancylobacter dichloromethanicus]MBS7556367.1 MerR family transcriptional regulator [Ancylobacter dichloromethanicus]